ncbi:MAG: hypothetical protein A2Y33_05580 [Spirochaetes bacterium GWF1_51_8]|nr:MAG: hypothetical protein A2Y33_05580 [Spirochaetes bacterium GWF1_51_8]
MKIDTNIPLRGNTRSAVPRQNPKPTAASAVQETAKVNFKAPAYKGLNMPAAMTREHLQEMAAYYNKVGRTYEEARSYKQAISAYEKANTVEPNIGTAKSIVNARIKEFKA